MKIIYVLAFLVFGVGLILFSYQSSVDRVTPTPTPIIKPTIKPTPTSTPEIALEDQLWKIINDWKKRTDKYEYIENEQLCITARKRLTQIKEDWSHDGMVSEARKLPFNQVAENLSKDELNPYYIYSLWLNSPSHLENLEANYKYSCIQCSDTYCVQLFASFDYL